MQGPEGEGLLQGLWAGRTVLGGSGEVPLPPGHPFRFTHSLWDLLGGKALLGPSPGMTQDVQGILRWETQGIPAEGAAPQGTSSLRGDTSIKTDRQEKNEVEVVVPAAS